MIRHLKILGLAFVAVFASSVLVASSASAHYVFTSGAVNTIITGAQSEGKNRFIVAGQSVECSTANFSGTRVGLETSEMTIVPSYSGCTYGAKTADITMNGCDYQFTGSTYFTGHGNVHILCPIIGSVKQKIEIHVTNFSGTETCTLTIGEQIPQQGYKAVNSGSNTVVTAEMTAITVTTDGVSLACKAIASVISSYVGSIQFSGYNDVGGVEGVQVSISVDS